MRIRQLLEPSTAKVPDTELARPGAAHRPHGDDEAGTHIVADGAAEERSEQARVRNLRLGDQAGRRPLRSAGRKGPGSAIRRRAASTWPHVFHRRTPRTRPSRK
jgi:hypothetical protein